MLIARGGGDVLLVKQIHDSGERCFGKIGVINESDHFCFMRFRDDFNPVKCKPLWDSGHVNTSNTGVILILTNMWD